MKLILHHLRRIAFKFQVFIWVVQNIHCDIAPELVIFGEDCDDGNFVESIALNKNTVMTDRDDEPF